MPTYIFKKSHIKNVCTAQVANTLASFDGCKMDAENIYIDYIDRNYLCEPQIDIIRDSGIHAISVFSGCGGLDIGTQMAGVKVISTLDFESDTVKTVKANKFFSFADHQCEDIRNITAQDYAEVLRKNNPNKLLMVGGPPCQPFSKAGYWITNEKRAAVDDERNMVGEYIRLISEIRPDGAILENVESILHPTNRAAVEFIENELTKMGYHFKRVLANAVDFGVPQKRKRVIFMISRNHIDGEPMKLTPEEATKVNVLDWIGRYDSSEFTEMEESVEGKTYGYELSEVPPGHNYIALSERDGYPNPKFIANKRFWNFLLKLHPMTPSWTIAAQPGPWVGPFHWENRRLRVNEVAAIQTFPMDYKFVGTRRTIQKQIGNAVPSILAKAFVKHLINFL